MENIMFKVLVGKSELEFTFDCVGDALDFATTCIENGYRVTIIPFETEDEEELTDADAIEQISRKLATLGERLQELGELGMRDLREAVQETGREV